MAIRTKQDRGEVVYQAAFDVDTKRTVVRLPYSRFRLVRGPRLVAGVPPLSAAQVNETYQMSIVVSKFEVSESGSALADFEEGLFALRLYAVGTYVETLTAGPTPTLPRALTEEEQKAAAPAMIKLLRPLLGVFFSEVRAAGGRANAPNTPVAYCLAPPRLDYLCKLPSCVSFLSTLARRPQGGARRQPSCCRRADHHGTSARGSGGRGARRAAGHSPQPVVPPPLYSATLEALC